MSSSEITGRVPSWRARSNSSQWVSKKYLLWILSYLMTSEMNPVPHTISLIIISSSKHNRDNWTGPLTTQTNSLNKHLCLINRWLITTWAFQHFHHWWRVQNKYFSTMEYSFLMEHFKWWTYHKMDSRIEH
jgi:hypothetical protein